MRLSVYPFLRLVLPLLLGAGWLTLAAQGPVSLRSDVVVSRVTAAPANTVRIDKHPQTGELYLLTEEGDLYRLDPQDRSTTLLFDSNDHGLQQTYGLEIGMTGNFYLAAAEQSNGFNVGKVAKGSPDGSGGYRWTLLAQTEPYRSSGNRDHQFNAIIESLDGQYVYVNSGSRTDHGEEARNDGRREMPLTAAILRIPVNAQNLLLQNDVAFLTQNGYLYADGVRNTYDLEYAANGHLFGIENSDTRDNEEELNWILPGKHYGFPWRIGTQMNPQQYPDFNPPQSDPLLIDGINMEGTFYNDPTFPAIPAGLTFMEPVRNLGPDADVFRDSVDGQIKDASDLDRSIGTFTPHSSPVALAFDTEHQLGAPYTGVGFAMSYNAASRRKYAPFLDPGEDLLMVELTYSAADSNYTAQVTRLVENFGGPIDNVLLGHELYVVEYGSSGIWKVTFPASTQGLGSARQSLGPVIQLFPNPARDHLALRSQNPEIQIEAATLWTFQGQQLTSLRPSSQGAWSADLSALPAGGYLVRVKTNRGTTLKRFTKSE